MCMKSIEFVEYPDYAPLLWAVVHDTLSVLKVGISHRNHLWVVAHKPRPTLLNRCHQIWPERTQICREFFSDPRTSNRRSVAQTVLEIFNFYSTHPTVDFALKSVMWFSDEHGVSRKKLLSSWKFHRSYTTTCATKQDHPELDSSCGSGTVDGASCQSSSSEKLCVTQPSGLKFSGWLLDT